MLSSCTSVAESGVGDLRHRIQLKPLNVEKTGTKLVQRLRVISGVINGKSYVVVATVVTLCVLSVVRCQDVRPRCLALPAYTVVAIQYCYTQPHRNSTDVIKVIRMIHQMKCTVNIKMSDVHCYDSLTVSCNRPMTDF